ncbi:MAG: hypothetical protein WD851_18770 [Pirellulales bacterium]
MSKSTTGRSTWWWPLGLIAAGLLVWGALFALGAYLDLGSERPDENSSRDWQKGLIVLGCTLGFLAFWGIALWNRSRRMRREKPER